MILSALPGYAQQTAISSFPLFIQHSNSSKPVILFLTGDGGMTSFSKELANQLYKEDFSIITLDTRKYFWKAKSPEQFGKDASQILNYYLSLWNKTSFSVVGYSFGADVGTFLPAQIGEKLKEDLKKLILLSPGISTDLETKVSNLLSISYERDAKFKIYPELQKLRLPVTCIFGRDEEAAIKQNIKTSSYIQKKEVPGGHKYNEDVSGIAKLIIQEVSN